MIKRQNDEMRKRKNNKETTWQHGKKIKRQKDKITK